MTPLSASAPGKVVLCGEYAVLNGAPAVSFAVNRRAQVNIQTSPDRYCHLRMPGFKSDACRFFLSDNGDIVWYDEPGTLLPEAAFRAVNLIGCRPFVCTIDTRAFAAPTSQRKYGLGGSAAAMTALTASLCRIRGQAGEVAELAAIAHAGFQDNRGSGIDVATSFHGGVVEYTMNRQLAIRQSTWPTGLYFEVLWTGKPASTRQRISSLDLSGPQTPAWTALISAAERTVDVWRRGLTVSVLAAIREYTGELAEFDAALNLGIFAAGHRELVQAAGSGPVVYKPCGAGGGDIGIALADDPDSLADFVRRATGLGFGKIDVNIAANGVAITADSTG